MANRILVALKGEARGFLRSKSTVFWTVAFPVLLILLFGAIFSGGGTGKYDVVVQDLSDSVASHIYIDALNQTGSLNIIHVSASENIDTYIKDNSPYAVLIIPANFAQAFAPNASANTTSLLLRTDPTTSSSAVVIGIVSGVSSQFNLYLAGGSNIITTSFGDITNENFTFIDFFLPGVIALTCMTTTIFWMVSVMTRYRTNGIFKKLTTTPITRYEWLTSQILWQLFVVFLSVTVIVTFGIFIFGAHLTLTWIAILTIILTSALFSSMGMIIARFIREEEAASAAANAITFPMMFLSGIFFPLSQMPTWLQAIAAVLPLTYAGNALRDTMVYGNTTGAINNMLVVAVLAVVFFVAGVALSKWKSE